MWGPVMYEMTGPHDCPHHLRARRPPACLTAGRTGWPTRRPPRRSDLVRLDRPARGPDYRNRTWPVPIVRPEGRTTVADRGHCRRVTRGCRADRDHDRAALLTRKSAGWPDRYHPQGARTEPAGLPPCPAPRSRLRFGVSCEAMTQFYGSERGCTTPTTASFAVFSAVHKSGRVIPRSGGLCTGRPHASSPACGRISEGGGQPGALVDRPLGVELGGDVGAADEVHRRAGRRPARRAARGAVPGRRR